MPRKPRIHFPGAIYHVMLRGNAGYDIFSDPADRCRFLLLLQQGLERYRHRAHAYCLMDNHIHLLLQSGDVPLSRLMQNLSFRYTQHINRKQKSSGHLFQGRFKALLVDAESYLLELVRYIHLNPVRAGLSTDPQYYSWSSHGCYLGRDDTPWLSTDWVLGQLDGNRDRARELYGEFIHEGLGEGHRKEFHRGSFEGRILGDDRFVEEALCRAESDYEKPLTLAAILQAVCEYYDVTMAALSAPGRHQPMAEARAVTACLVQQTQTLQLKELGIRLHRDLSGLSQAARRLEGKTKEDAKMVQKLNSIQILAENLC